MEFKIKVFQNDEGIFAEVLNEDGKQICVGDGDSPCSAVKDVCLVLSDIMDFLDEKENVELLNSTNERLKNDDGTRYSTEEVKQMRLDR